MKELAELNAIYQKMSTPDVDEAMIVTNADKRTVMVTAMAMEMVKDLKDLNQTSLTQIKMATRQNQ